VPPPSSWHWEAKYDARGGCDGSAAATVSKLMSYKQTPLALSRGIRWLPLQQDRGT
jgi:hypothetical protein